MFAFTLNPEARTIGAAIRRMTVAPAPCPQKIGNSPPMIAVTVMIWDGRGPLNDGFAQGGDALLPPLVFEASSEPHPRSA